MEFHFWLSSLFGLVNVVTCIETVFTVRQTDYIFIQVVRRVFEDSGNIMKTVAVLSNTLWGFLKITRNVTNGTNWLELNG